MARDRRPEWNTPTAVHRQLLAPGQAARGCAGHQGTVDGRVHAIVTFRNADEPRALAGRLIATAHRHRDGWLLHMPDVGTADHPSIEDAVAAVSHATGMTRILMVLTTADCPGSAPPCRSHGHGG
ncbi:hypothetical protein KRM28CT15_19870 [Krasilnikovia sp. M28-CT-15]